MSAVQLLSSLREKSNQSQNDDSHHEGHEDGGVPSGGGGDPAVLAVGPSRKPITYTRDELMKLRHSPLVKKGLETAFAGCEALALVLKKRSDSPNEEDRGARGDAPSENHKAGVFPRERRSADPRERVRKESEPSSGIVLSPQRRSFTSGCGAPAAPAPAPAPHPHPAHALARARPESPRAGTAQGPKPEPGGRRIGSGRIMVRDDVRENRTGGTERGAGGAERGTGGGGTGAPERGVWDEDYRSEPYRPPHQHRLNNNDRYDRRSFTRDSYASDIKREREDRFNNDKLRDREDNRRSGGRYQRRYDKEDEPEWFSGGPTSQLETIELRGFDEPTKKNGTNSKENETGNEKWNSRSRSPEWRDTSSPVSHQQDSTGHNNSNDKDSGVESKAEEPMSNADQHEFNLDEFLKLDDIPDVLQNGGGEAEGGSRFSQWFRRESPTNDRHYERLLNNMVDELDRPIRNENEASHVFAPISPARPPPHAHAQPPPSLMDLLMRANEQRQEGPPGGGGAPGKVHSLEELEARLRPGGGPAHHAPPAHHAHQPHPENDLAAFKRLLAQVSGGHAVAAAPEPPRPHHQPMSLLQMLNKSMEQQQKAQQQQQQQQQHQQQQQPHIPQDLLYKLLQVQQRQQQQNEMNVHITPGDRELLQRPEAQAIIHGLKSGEITSQHLMQQLGNPGLQSRHREMLLTVLRLHHQQRQQQMGSPLPMGGAAPHLVLPPHHQPLRLSPQTPQGVPARIPSPRELAVHTQSIMQSALIKKKLEEQRENYNRRRHEIHHQPKQATPISFTPTSVLRKMTAEKESETPSPKQQWNQPPKMPQMGRPIVKGNQSGAGAPTVGYAPDYQQHYLNQQQQQMIGVRPFQHPQQQRQQVPNSFNNMSMGGRGMPANTTLHQLLVQSHQRSLNEMGGSSGGGDNQLARWFSPELLARASAGKLPSVHVPNALSLEDLERHHHSPAPPVRN